MSIPGPSGVPLALGLLVFAAAMAVVGEATRRLAARWVTFFRDPDPIERSLLDLWLGGAVLYVVSAFPVGLFYPQTLPVLVIVSGAVILLTALRTGHPPRGLHPRTARSPFPYLHLAAAGAAGVVLAVEVAAAAAVPTGNTFDSSLFTTYVALFLGHHTLPLSLSPVANVALAYPQGTTAVFGYSQSLLGLPPARTALLTTPLFMALVPLAAFTWGRRVTGLASTGAAFAILFALFGEWTRTLVGGSNDFVLAFPLVLLLWGWMPCIWATAIPVRWGDALGFGVLLGLSASLNPVGAEVTVLAVPILWALRLRGLPGAWRRLATFVASLAAGALFVLPSLYVIAVHGGLAATSTLAGQVVPTGLTGAQFVGHIDPFLFRPGDDNLSSFPLLRAELAALLILGVIVLFWTRSNRSSRSPETRFGPPALALGASGISLLILASLPWPAGSALSSVARATSVDQLAYLMFTLFTAIASLPLAAMLRLAEPSTPPTSSASLGSSGGRTRFRLGRIRAPRPIEAAVIALLLVSPGIAVTATSFSPAIVSVYERLGNVSDADFQMLSWSEAHLPAGARVVVAPGSAGQFIPGYQAQVVLLYPVLVFGVAANISYANVVRELSNGTLDAQAVHDLGVLRAQYIVVTQANTVLWPPFSPSPLLSNPSATVAFHVGDAYVFLWS